MSSAYTILRFDKEKDGIAYLRVNETREHDWIRADKCVKVLSSGNFTGFVHVQSLIEAVTGTHDAPDPEYWIRTPDACRVFDEIRRDYYRYGVIPSAGKDVVTVMRVNTADEMRGTWLHPRALLSFCHWLDPRLLVHLYDWPMHLINGDIRMIDELRFSDAAPPAS
eukprot:jgi/Mesvir1/7779/Mv11722-RA.1